MSENKIEGYLGIDIRQLKKEILELALHIERNNSRIVLLRIYGERDYSVSIIDKSALFKKTDEEFAFTFSLIDPWSISGFESIFYDDDNDVYVDVLNDEEFTIEELLKEAFHNAVNGYCPSFEDEWKKFLIEFNNYLNSN